MIKLPTLFRALKVANPRQIEKIQDELEFFIDKRLKVLMEPRSGTLKLSEALANLSPHQINDLEESLAHLGLSIGSLFQGAIQEGKATLTEYLEFKFKEDWRKASEECTLISVKQKPDTSCCMGIEDGSGNFFVYGSYESIKHLQNKLINNKK